MSRVTIVTGAPGSGKTTFSKFLAREDPRGIHFVSDVFYGFPAHPIDPTKPESREQNTAIMRAVGRAAGGFVESGFPVVLDGIFGPWFLPELRAALPADVTTEYVVLCAPLALSLERVRGRDGPGASAKVEHMHRAFADLGDLAAHALESGDLGVEELLGRFFEGRTQGRFDLS